MTSSWFFILQSDPYSDILAIQLSVTLCSPFLVFRVAGVQKIRTKKHVFCLSCISSVVLPVWTPEEIANVFFSLRALLKNDNA